MASTRNRQKYDSTFSISNWNALSVQVRQKHTLACCQDCCSNHQDLQLSFPLKPCFEDTPLVSVNVQKLEKLGKMAGTIIALTDLNSSFSDVFQLLIPLLLTVAKEYRYMQSQNPHCTTPLIFFPAITPPPSLLTLLHVYNITLQVKPFSVEKKIKSSIQKVS